MWSTSAVLNDPERNETSPRTLFRTWCELRLGQKYRNYSPEAIVQHKCPFFCDEEGQKQSILETLGEAWVTAQDYSVSTKAVQQFRRAAELLAHASIIES